MKNVSRFLLAVFAVFYAVSATGSLQAAQAAIVEEEYVSPVLSFGQVRDLKDRFVFWLGKHYRCLYGGRCTKVEKAQVTAEWKLWIKRLGFAAVVGLAYYFGSTKGVPAAKKAFGEAKKAPDVLVAKMFAAIDREMLGKPGDPAGVPLTPTERRRRVAEFATDLTSAVSAGIIQTAEQTILAEASDPAGVPLTPEQRRDRVAQLVGELTSAAVKQGIDIEEGQTLPGWTESLVERVLQKLESREVQLPGWQRARIVPARKQGEAELAREAAELLLRQMTAAQPAGAGAQEEAAATSVSEGESEEEEGDIGW